MKNRGNFLNVLIVSILQKSRIYARGMGWLQICAYFGRYAKFFKKINSCEEKAEMASIKFKNKCNILIFNRFTLSLSSFKSM